MMQLMRNGKGGDELNLIVWVSGNERGKICQARRRSRSRSRE
jgi:hypothetical protein